MASSKAKTGTSSWSNSDRDDKPEAKPPEPEAAKVATPSKAEALVASTPAVPKFTKTDKGYVQLEAVTTCLAYGMPFFAGQRFTAKEDEALRLVDKGHAKLV
jgi:hypothetical protein